eukprot:UN3001
MEDVSAAEGPPVQNNPAEDDPPGESTNIPAAPLGPPAVTVEFMWGCQTFRRTEKTQCGRFVYKARGTVDGRGGLELSYSEHGGGSWELGSESGGCLYRYRTDGDTPSVLVGNLQWSRRSGGTIYVTLMQSAASSENGGWVDPALLAFHRKW